MTMDTPMEAREWLERVRSLAPIVEKWRDAGEQGRRMPRPLFEALRSADIFRLSTPRTAGGAELDEMTVMLTIEELSRQDGSVGWNTMIASNAAVITSYLPGTSGIYTSSRLQRCFRDIHVANQHITVAGSNIEMVGQYLLGLGLQLRR